MKHVISVCRDLLDDQGVLVAQETESLELDDKVDPPEVWDHYMAKGAFAVEPAADASARINAAAEQLPETERKAEAEFRRTS